MKINHLTLTTFRNIDHLSIAFDSDINVFYGNNGHGKTNIIESIVYLSYGRSFRNVADHVLIQKDATFGKIEAELESSDRLTVVLSDQGKYLSVNRAPLKTLSEFIGYANIVLFCPDDLNFFSQSPRVRRRVLDYELGKMSDTYMSELILANKVLAERNAYLKTSQFDRDFFDVLNERYIDHAYKIMKQRHGLCQYLSPLIERYYCALSETDTKVLLSYHTFSSIDKADMLSKILNSERRDREFRTSHVGIHRDDYTFSLNGELVQNMASQGQKRMLMLAFKLAIVDAITSLKKETPILCLDDLFSELDERRRHLVFKLLPMHLQVMITTTDRSFVEGVKNATYYRVDRGTVEREASYGTNESRS